MKLFNKRKNFEIVEMPTSTDSQIYHGEQWLIKNGLSKGSKHIHNQIAANITLHYPEILDYEYKIPYSEEDFKVDFIAYLGFWKLLWLSITFRIINLKEGIEDVITTYLGVDYRVDVTIKRLKKG